VAALAAGVLAPQVLGNQGDRGTTPATHTQTLQLPAPNNPAWQKLSTWPTRGSLAGDKGFMTAVLARFDGEAPRILFAGDVEDRRVVLAFQRIAVPVDGPAGAGVDEQIQVLSGPRGARIDQLEMGSNNSPGDVNTLVVRRDQGPDGWLMVLAPRDVRTAEVSASVSISPSGTVSRTWSSLPLSDGVGVIQLRNAPVAVTRVRAGGYDGNLQVLAGNTDQEQPNAAAFCGGCGDSFYASGLDAARDAMATALGLRPDQVEVSAQVQGRIDRALQGKDGTLGGPGSVGRVLVVNGRIPGGAVVRTVAVSVTEKDGSGSVYQAEDIVPIDAATADRRPWATWVDDPAGQGLVVQVFAPGAASVQIRSESATIYPGSSRAPVKNGSAVVDIASGQNAVQHLSVVTYDAAGRELGTWPLQPTNLGDPLDLSPDN
jgi:hypothetical protein